MKYKVIFKECALYAHSFSVPFKRGQSNTDKTNNANITIARETNQANRDIASETNEANIAMNNANNELQMRLQQEMNEYNSVASQLERAREAGVNPNAVLNGNISGNLQNTLPSTSAGHSEIGNPMLPAHLENSYMERLATAQLLEQLGNDVVRNMNTGAQTELTHAQAQGQRSENRWIDDLRGLQSSLGRAQTQKLVKEVDVLGDQQQLMREQTNGIKANIANMNEGTRSKFLDNYFKVEERNSFISYVREDLDKRGIPRNAQMSDDAILAVRYGALSAWNVPLSQEQVGITQSYLNKAGVGVQNALRNLTEAKTKGVYIENALNEMFGPSERMSNAMEADSRTNLNNASANKVRQDIKINKWQESEEVQTQRVYSITVGNLQTEANIRNTDVNTAKQGVETVKEGVGIVKQLTPWAR